MKIQISEIDTFQFSRLVKYFKRDFAFYNTILRIARRAHQILELRDDLNVSPSQFKSLVKTVAILLLV